MINEISYILFQINSQSPPSFSPPALNREVEQSGSHAPDLPEAGSWWEDT